MTPMFILQKILRNEALSQQEKDACRAIFKYEPEVIQKLADSEKRELDALEALEALKEPSVLRNLTHGEIRELESYKTPVPRNLSADEIKAIVEADQLPDSEMKAIREQEQLDRDKGELEALAVMLKEENLNAYGLDPKLYLKLLPILRLAAELEQTEDAEMQAFKLAVIFESEKEALDYLDNYYAQHPNSDKFVHSACLFVLPTVNPEKELFWDLKAWRSLVQKHMLNPEFVKVLRVAAKIENFLKADPKKLEEELRVEILKEYSLNFLQEFENYLAEQRQFQTNLKQELRRRDISAKTWFEEEFKRQFDASLGVEFKKHTEGKLFKTTVKQKFDKHAKEKLGISLDAPNLTREEGQKLKEYANSPEGQAARKEIEAAHWKVAQQELQQKLAFELKTKLAAKMEKTKVLLNLDLDDKGVVESLKEEFLQNRFKQEKNAIEARIKMMLKFQVTPETSLETLKYYAKYVYYDRAEEWPEVAELFTQYNIPDAGFDLYLTLTPKDDPDKIPGDLYMEIEGASLNHPGFYLKRLSPFDPKAAVLGQMTSCCQSMGWEGQASTVHGITQENGGFYVLCQKKGLRPDSTDPIIAQCWAWRGDRQQIIFDSIETQFNFRTRRFENGVEGNQIVHDFYLALAQKLVQTKKTPFVFVGVGGETLGSLKSFQLNAESYPSAVSELELSRLPYNDVQYGVSCLADQNLPFHIFLSTAPFEIRRKMFMEWSRQPGHEAWLKKWMETIDLKKLWSDEHHRRVALELFSIASENFLDDVMIACKKMRDASIIWDQVEVLKFAIAKESYKFATALLENKASLDVEDLPKDGNVIKKQLLDAIYQSNIDQVLFYVKFLEVHSWRYKWEQGEWREEGAWTNLALAEALVHDKQKIVKALLGEKDQAKKILEGLYKQMTSNFTKDLIAQDNLERVKYLLSLYNRAGLFKNRDWEISDLLFHVISEEVDLPNIFNFLAAECPSSRWDRFAEHLVEMAVSKPDKYIKMFRVFIEGKVLDRENWHLIIKLLKIPSLFKELIDRKVFSINDVIQIFIEPLAASLRGEPYQHYGHYYTDHQAANRLSYKPRNSAKLEKADLEFIFLAGLYRTYDSFLDNGHIRFCLEVANMDPNMVFVLDKYKEYEYERSTRLTPLLFLLSNLSFNDLERDLQNIRFLLERGADPNLKVLINPGDTFGAYSEPMNAIELIQRPGLYQGNVRTAVLNLLEEFAKKSVDKKLRAEDGAKAVDFQYQQQLAEENARRKEEEERRKKEESSKLPPEPP